ncbi:hypothetical protein C6N75_01955 [Streptomyces solincola]|uniref:Uncharacterized protein n=1 Tax=Streptomyces solincola TaxID=2100817 RepID=A0A2S9Q2H6_9ACTN|nr:hypothetical protein [Streptomyces solincola]PRH80838.1 hypothetical protein C6N75_01955 [Streptomyces solincola]
MTARLEARLRAAVRAADAHGDLEVARVLDGFGTPETAVLPELAQELRDRNDSRTGWTLILLGLAGLLFVVAWPLGLVAAAVGVHQLWTSDRWRRHERVLGTLAPVTGPLVSLVVARVSAVAPAGGYWILIAPVLALCVPVAISGYLYVSLRRRTT